jgi:sugar (pentulose or hexulose) kinase
MAGPLLIGVDVGTSLVKSVAFDRSGRAVAMAKRVPRVVNARQGWSEIDMEGLWRDVLATLAEVAADSKIDAREVQGIGVSGTCCSSWLIDHSGAPVRSAILWNDGRAADIVRGWSQSGLMDDLFGICGNAIFPGFSVAVLRWLKDNEPETLARASRTVFCKDWIRYRMTGEQATDHTDASALPYDIRIGAYSSEVMKTCGVEEAMALLPPLLDPGAIAGRLLPEVARATGLPSGLPIVAGMMDVAASTLGAGAARPGQACTIVGTSFLNCFLTAAPTFEPRSTGIQMRTAGGYWLRGMVNTAGTMNLDWFLNQFCADAKAAAEAGKENIFSWAEREAASIPIGSGGVLYHPYLNSAGVISPFFHPAARAQFFGLGVEHTRAHLLRAVYEGVALAMRDCAEAMPGAVGEWLIAGGGSDSEFWRQMFADCTGRTIVAPEGEEFGARGVAMLAGVATGVYADLAEAVAAVRSVKRVHVPDQANYERYTEIYRLFRDIRDGQTDHWWRRHDMLVKQDAPDRSAV